LPIVKRKHPEPVRNETKTFPQADLSALPGPIKRVLHAAGATIKPATGADDGYHEAVASVSPDEPNTIQVEDPQRFAQNAAQTVAHEAFHVWRLNLPPHIRALAPQDDTDQYNYADPGTMRMLRAQGKRLWNLPEESGATAMQYYTSQGGENAPKAVRDAYGPWAKDMEAPMSTMLPTPANAQELNTAPRPPTAMYETKTFKPLKPANSRSFETEQENHSDEPTFEKGQRVVLPDGTKGRIAHMVHAMKTARVRTDDGRNLTLRLGALKPADAVLVKEHFRRAPH
jgi:hypothetical protein